MNRQAIRQTLINLPLLGLGYESGFRGDSAPLAANEWALLVDLATRHEIVPLVRRGVCNAGIDAPFNVSAALIQADRAFEFRAMLALDQLEEALSAFETAHLEVIVLKGALFAAHYYPSPGLRPFGDLDLLVRRKDLSKAVEALECLGYEAFQGYDGRGQAWWTEHHNHWIFKKPGALPVELHWALTPPRSEVQFDESSLWRDSARVSDRPHVRQMSDVDQLLYLAVHAVKHQLALPLRNIVDAAVALRKSGFSEWQRLVERAESIGAAQDLAAYLLTARELGFVSLPPAFCAQMEGALGRRLSPVALARYAVEWPLLDMPHALVRASGNRSLLRKLRAVRTALAAPAPHAESSSISAAREQQSRLLRRLKKAWKLPQSASDVRTATAIHEIFSGRDAP